MQDNIKPLGQLSKSQLLYLAMVLQDIKYRLGDNLNKNSVIYILPFVVNDYFFANKDEFYIDEDEGHETYSNQALKDNRYKMLLYLQDEGVVKTIKVHKYKTRHPVSGYYMEVENFEITINEKLFLDYYSAVTKLAKTYLEEHIRKRDYEESEFRPEVQNEVIAEIKLVDSVVSLWLSNIGLLPLRSLRVDGPQFNFINYILSHPTVDISRADVQLKVDGCASKKDLTEIVRSCGFNTELKRMFFPRCTQLKVRFTPSIQLSKLKAEQLTQKYKS